jgi:hypothetical protein
MNAAVVCGTTPLEPLDEEPNPHPGAAFDHLTRVRDSTPTPPSHSFWSTVGAGPQRAQEQVSLPRGSGRVQFCVTPSCVITTFAVAEPS